MDDARVALERDLDLAGRRGDLEAGRRLICLLVGEGHWDPPGEVRALLADCPPFLPGLWRCLLIREGPWSRLAPRRHELAARVAGRVLCGDEARAPLAQSRAWWIARVATTALRRERAAWIGPGGPVEATLLRDLNGWRGLAHTGRAGRLSADDRRRLRPAPGALDLQCARLGAALRDCPAVEGAPSLAAAIAELQRLSGAGAGAPLLRPRRPGGPGAPSPTSVAGLQAGRRRVMGALGLDEPLAPPAPAASRRR